MTVGDTVLCNLECTKLYSFESDIGAGNYPKDFSSELLDSDTNKYVLANKSNYVEQSKYI